MDIITKIDNYLDEGFLKRFGDFINKLEGMPTDKEWEEIQNIIKNANTFEDLANAYIKDPSDVAGEINADLIKRARELYKEYQAKGKKMPSGIEDAMEDANKKKWRSYGKLQKWFRKNAR